jgi:hypothetical protein
MNISDHHHKLRISYRMSFRYGRFLNPSPHNVKEREPRCEMFPEIFRHSGAGLKIFRTVHCLIHLHGFAFLDT